MKYLPFLLLCFAACAPAETPTVELPELPARYQQLLVVETPNDTSYRGTLRRYQRMGANWQSVGAGIPVTTGRNGLGWGIGRHEEPQNTYGIPRKREGDGKAPMGIFELGTSFGVPASVDWKTPYLQLTDVTECVDDDQHPFYNQIRPDTLPIRSWNSSERMLAVGARYEFGLFVEHNTPMVPPESPEEPGNGSCIFLHVWGGPNVPTSGCTAMARADLLDVLRWLDPVTETLLIQATSAQLPHLRYAESETNRTSQPTDASVEIVVPEARIAAYLRNDLALELNDLKPEYRRFSYEAHDLNGNGKPEYLVTFRNPYFCGSGGCNLLIFREDFTLKNRLTVVRFPSYIGETEKNWADLLLFSDVRACAGQPHRLVHRKGKGYPPNPSMAPCSEVDLTGLTAIFDTERTGVEEYAF